MLIFSQLLLSTAPGN